MTPQRRSPSPNQVDLFGTPATPVAAPARPAPPVRHRTPARSRAGTPAVATDVLAEVRDGRYGLMDDTDRVVVFEDGDHVRLALDEEIIHHLITGRYIERGPARDTVSCLHGVIRRPVSPLRLTKDGRTLLGRWSAYTPLGGGE